MDSETTAKVLTIMKGMNSLLRSCNRRTVGFNHCTQVLPDIAKSFMLTYRNVLLDSSRRINPLSGPTNRPLDSYSWSPVAKQVSYDDASGVNAIRATRQTSQLRLREVQDTSFVMHIPKASLDPGLLIHFTQEFDLHPDLRKHGIYAAAKDVFRKRKAKFFKPGNATFQMLSMNDEGCITKAPKLSADVLLVANGFKCYMMTVLQFFIKRAPSDSLLYAAPMPVTPKQVQEVGQIIEKQPTAIRYLLFDCLKLLRYLSPDFRFSEAELIDVLCEAIARLIGFFKGRKRVLNRRLDGSVQPKRRKCDTTATDSDVDNA